MTRRALATDVMLLKHHLTALGLPTFQAECEQAARECARANVDHLGFLLRLCEHELAHRCRRATERRIFSEVSWRWPELDGVEPLELEIEPWDPPRAQDEFTRRFERLTAARTAG